MYKVFMGGTVGTFNWRDRLIKDVGCCGLEFINPVVSNRGIEEINLEILNRKECDISLYCITPEMRGVYSIAEVVEDSIKKPKGSTLFYVYDKDTYDSQCSLLNRFKYTDGLQYSFDDVCNLLKRNGAKVFDTYNDLVTYLRNYKDMIKAFEYEESMAYTE